MSKMLKTGLAGALLVLAVPAWPVDASARAEPAIRCEGGRCEGTPENDVIVASTGKERVFGLAGDDDIELDEAVAVGSDDFALGGRGRDCIDGGAGRDVIIAGPGDDNRPCEFSAFVNPRAGLTSGPGDDVVRGGQGNDSMDGIADDDLLIGGLGNDRIEDPSPMDADRLRGGPGRDILNATDGDGDDVIVGGPGKHMCSGDPGDVIKSC